MQGPASEFGHTLEGNIAFVSRDSTGNDEICAIQAVGANRRRLIAFPIDDAICFLRCSPNGDQILFTSRQSGNYELHVINADGSDQKQLTNMRSTTYGGSWSPDGRYIAFTSTNSGTEEVYSMLADGSSIKRLTATSYFEKAQPFAIPKAYNKNPTWSPDGQRIAFASERSGNQEIHIMNADGSGSWQLTESDGMKDFLSWSPDGEYIAFVHHGISVIDKNGTNSRQLTTPTFFDSHPCWSPDSQYIAYGSRVDVNRTTRPPQIGHTEIFIMHVETAKSIRLTAAELDNDCPSWKR